MLGGKREGRPFLSFKRSWSGQGEQIGCPHSSLKGGSRPGGTLKALQGGRELCVSLIHLENEANSNYCRGFSEIR